jgi:hypothetical protein
MDPQAGRAAFGIGIFLTLSAIGLLLVLRPGTAEHSITVVTLVIGLIFIGLVVLFVRGLGR